MDILVLPFWLVLVILFIVGFIQNMAFTAVSRSRNSGDINHHFKTAIVSNMIWFICNFFILFGAMLKALTDGNTLDILIIMVVYSLSTSLGSVVMMAINLGKIKFPRGLKWLEKFLVEEGTKRVGARDKQT